MSEKNFNFDTVSRYECMKNFPIQLQNEWNLPLWDKYLHKKLRFDNINHAELRSL